MSSPSASADRNLLFGALALQADLIDQCQFAEICIAWTARKRTPLADLLVERGWLSTEECADVEKLVARKLKKHGGDAHASLAAVTTDAVRDSLADVADAEVRQSLAGLPTPPQGHALVTTVAHLPESRDRYTLSRLHATGGIGRVWLARDASLTRDVALKELRPEGAANPAVRRVSSRRRGSPAELEHPGIVPIYEVSQRLEDQAPFYTMRFVRGRTLGQAIRTYHERRVRGAAGPLELRELLGAFVGVCNAVAYAHSRGVLHRDLKPQNVVLGDFGEVIVLDWGLARLMHETVTDAAPLEVPEQSDEGATVLGQVLGTPAYMAPEQAEGRLDQLGPATDVYGLGATLYELLTGKPPFTGSEATDVLRQVTHEPPAAPRSAVPDTPRALEAVCLKALLKKPDERYGTAKELASEVEHWLAGEPVAVYREPLSARAWRWIRRHRTLVSGTAAAALVALVGLAVVLGLQARANAELRAANERERERFDLAMDAIKTFHTGVSEDVLLKQEQFKELRNRLLKGAAEFYGRLEALLENQSDIRSQRALGAAYYQLGTLTEKIGSKQEALAVHRKALAVRKKLVKSKAEDDAKVDVVLSLVMVGTLQRNTGALADARETLEEATRQGEALCSETQASGAAEEALASSYYAIGELLSDTGKRKEALESYRKALAIRQKLADAHPSVARLRFDVAGSYRVIAIELSHTGKGKEALETHREALAIQQKLAQADPSVIACQNDMALSHNLIGWLLSQTGKRQEALESYRKALSIRQKLVDVNPADTLLQSNLAWSHYSIGLELGQTGKGKEALESHRKALAIRQRLADANPTVTVLQSELATSHSNIGILLSQTGNFKEALEAYGQALAIRQKLAAANPAVTTFQSDLASSHNNIGTLLFRRKKLKEAMAAYREALVIRQKLADANASVTYFQRELAGSHYNIGLVLRLMGKGKEALESWNKALAIWQKLADANPSVVEIQSDLASSHNYIAVMLDETGKVEEALEAHRKALAIRQKLAEKYPAVPGYQVELGGSCCNLGSLLRDAGRPAESVPWFDRAIGTLTRVHRQDPQVMFPRQFLRNSFSGRARAYDRLEKHAEAMKDWDRAIELCSEQEMQSLQVERATSMVRAGKVAEAVAGVAELMKGGKWSADEWYDLACFHAVASGKAADKKREYADRAMELLHKSVKAGYKNAGHMAKDKDLDVLRGRDDFKKLLQLLPKTKGKEKQPVGVPSKK